MRAGKLNHRMEILRQDQAASLNSHGGVTPDEKWDAIDERWASIEPTSGVEVFEGQQTHGRVTHKIRMRHVGDIRPSDRLRIRSTTRVFEIESILNPREADTETELMCMERINA